MTTHRQTVAIHAALAVAHRHGIRCTDPQILRDSNHTIIHLAPSPVVARVATTSHARSGIARLQRELAVVQHLAQLQAPVLPPTSEAPPGPHVVAESALTLWQLVEHDADHAVDPLVAGASFRIVADGLASYSGDLPRYTDDSDACRRLLDDRAALAVLAESDRRFLISAHERLHRHVDSLDFQPVALHGDPHLGNLLWTAHGPLWTDFESACIGPIEWALTCLPEAGLAAFPATDRRRLAILGDLRSLCVAVWCSVTPNRAAVARDAAAFHLRRLRASRVG